MVQMPSGKTRTKLIVAVVVVLVVLSSALVVLYKFNGNSLDLSNREVRLIPTSSMDGERTEYPIPTIPKDSLVMIEKLGQDDLDSIKVGDVICFDYSGIYIVHRVVEIDEVGKKFITHGDNNSPSNRESVDFEQVRGKVVGVSHFMGEVVTFVKSSMLLAILTLAVVIIAIWAVVDIVKVIREGDEDKEKNDEDADSAKPSCEVFQHTEDHKGRE